MFQNLFSTFFKIKNQKIEITLKIKMNQKTIISFLDEEFENEQSDKEILKIISESELYFQLIQD